jgi:hypothetical protein
MGVFAILVLGRLVELTVRELTRTGKELPASNGPLPGSALLIRTLGIKTPRSDELDDNHSDLMVYPSCRSHKQDHIWGWLNYMTPTTSQH